MGLKLDPLNGGSAWVGFTASQPDDGTAQDILGLGIHQSLAYENTAGDSAGWGSDHFCFRRSPDGSHLSAGILESERHTDDGEGDTD